MSVIITSAKYKNALAAIRSLGKKGISVISADDTKLAKGFFSKYCKKYFIYPNPQLFSIEFIETIIRFVKDNPCEMIMPIDAETYYISKYKKDLSNYVKVPVSDFKYMKIADNKWHTLKMANKLKIPIPKTYFYSISNDDNIREIINQFEIYPIVIKAEIGKGGQNVRYALNKNDFYLKFKELTKKLKCDRFLIQEYIPGNNYCVCTMFNQGNLHRICVHKELRELPVTGGSGTARISGRNDEMAKYAISILKNLNWTGVAMVEFKLDQRDNTPKLMEINPRFWGSLFHSIVSGVDFPFLLYRMTMNGDIDLSIDYKIGIKTRWISGDIKSLLQFCKLKNRRMFSMNEFWREFFSLTYHRYEDFSLDDPLPDIMKILTIR